MQSSLRSLLSSFDPAVESALREKIMLGEASSNIILHRLNELQGQQLFEREPYYLHAFEENISPSTDTGRDKFDRFTIYEDIKILLQEKGRRIPLSKDAFQKISSSIFNNTRSYSALKSRYSDYLMKLSHKDLTTIVTFAMENGPDVLKQAFFSVRDHKIKFNKKLKSPKSLLKEPCDSFIAYTSYNQTYEMPYKTSDQYNIDQFFTKDDPKPSLMNYEKLTKLVKKNDDHINLATNLNTKTDFNQENEKELSSKNLEKNLRKSSNKNIPHSSFTVTRTLEELHSFCPIDVEFSNKQLFRQHLKKGNVNQKNQMNSDFSKIQIISNDSWRLRLFIDNR